MRLEKPRLAKYIGDAKLRGYAVLPKIFFALTESSQAAGEAFIGRLAKRKEDLEPASGPEVAAAQIAANLPNAVLLTYPDSGHGSLFQFHDSFTRQATAFLASDSPFAPY